MNESCNNQCSSCMEDCADRTESYAAEECSHDCSSCSANCGSRVEDFKAANNPMNNIKHVIAVMSGKGGVGKSMVSSLLAVLARRRGYRSAIMDGDITGPSIPQAFGLKGNAEGSEFGILPVITTTGIPVMSLNLLLENKTDPVVWRGPVVGGVIKQFWSDVVWSNVDYMFIDMPPGTGDVPLTVFQSLPIDGVIVVTSPQELVGMIVEKAVNMAKLMNIPVLGLVENMSYITCPDCGRKISVFGEGKTEEAAKRYGVENVAKLPIEPKLAAACDAGLIELFDGDWLNGIMDMIEKNFPVE